MGCLPPINSCRISQPSTVWLDDDLQWLCVFVFFFLRWGWHYPPLPVQSMDTDIWQVFADIYFCVMFIFRMLDVPKTLQKIFPWDLQANIHAPMSFMLLVYLVFNAWHFLIYVDFLDHDVLVHVFDLAGSDDPLLLVPFFFLFFSACQKGQRNDRQVGVDPGWDRTGQPV